MTTALTHTNDHWQSVRQAAIKSHSRLLSFTLAEYATILRAVTNQHKVYIAV